MRVLVACEFSGVVREAFRAKGHNAWSCDLLPADDGSDYHYEGDINDLLAETPDWDLIIAHPPCTYLSVSGNRYYSNRSDLYLPAVEFAKQFFDYAEKVCVENPVGRLSSHWRKPDQYIQPWEFGHDASKKTGLWLQGLPKLQPTKILKKERYANQTPSGQNNLGPSKDRAKLRSITYQGIAEAMAEQWGNVKMNTDVISTVSVTNNG